MIKIKVQEKKAKVLQQFIYLPKMLREWLRTEKGCYLTATKNDDGSVTLRKDHQ